MHIPPHGIEVAKGYVLSLSLLLSIQSAEKLNPTKYNIFTATKKG
jgi:hypothetical protein